MTFLIRSLLLLVASCALTVQAADTGWLRNAQNSHAEVRLRAAPQGDHLQLLLDIRLQPGWKTYWRSPGEGGVAPEIRWQTPDVNARWSWPVPARFDVSGLTTQGYKGDVTLPIVLESAPQGTLAGTLTLSTCSDVCILTDFPFQLDLSQPASPDFARDFAQAMGQIPADSGLTDQLDASFVDGTLQIRAQRQQGWQQPELFFDYPQGSMLAAPQISVQGETLTARVAVTDEWGEAAPDLRGKALSLVITDAGIAQQSQLTLGHQPLFSPSAGNATLWSVVLLALLGGLILNLMPCVLPVLAIKLSSLVQQQGQTQRQTRQQFLASSAGILFSFLLLALLMTVLRLSGQALGWGIQFQSSGFLLVMVLVMFLFSASLFDLLHFRLPSGLTTRLATHGGAGLAGHFGQGAFATLLATPCSAPFLGTAVAYALTAAVAAVCRARRRHESAVAAGCGAAGHGALPAASGALDAASAHAAGAADAAGNAVAGDAADSPLGQHRRHSAGGHHYAGADGLANRTPRAAAGRSGVHYRDAGGRAVTADASLTGRRIAGVATADRSRHQSGAGAG